MGYISPAKKLKSVYSYYHVTSCDSKHKNKFIIKDIMSPYLPDQEIITRETAVFNLNIGLNVPMNKLRAYGQDNRKAACNGKTQIKRIK